MIRLSYAFQDIMLGGDYSGEYARVQTVFLSKVLVAVGPCGLAAPRSVFTGMYKISTKLLTWRCDRSISLKSSWSITTPLLLVF